MAHLKWLDVNSGSPGDKEEALAVGTQQQSCDPSGMAATRWDSFHTCRERGYRCCSKGRVGSQGGGCVISEKGWLECVGLHCVAGVETAEPVDKGKRTEQHQ